MAISVAVPKNLSGIKTKVALNLTKRQLICFSGAGAVGIPFYIFTKGFIGTQASALLIDVRYNMDTDELIDVKERMEHPIDTNLSVMGQAEQLINQLEAEKNIFTSEERNLIVNYAYKLDDMNKTRELAEKLAYREQYAQQDVALTIIDAKAEIDALPDPMIGLSEMREYGYQWNEMLPLTQLLAVEKKKKLKKVNCSGENVL